MQGDALTEVDSPFIEGLPIPVPTQHGAPYHVSVYLQAKLQVVLQVDANICAGCDRHEGGPQFSIMDPYLNVLAVKEHIQPTCVVKMQVTDDDLLDIFKFVACGFDSSLELMLRLVSHPCEDIRDRRAPDLWIVLSAPSLPQNEPLVGMLNQDTIHGQLTTLVDESLALCALQTGVASTNDEGLVTFEPSNLEDVELGTLGAYIRDVAWNGASIELSLYSSHA